MSASLVLIAAVSRNGVIGDGLTMPWKIKEDLQHFKETTLNHTVIMGRKTFESIGSKPLVGRTNIVLSRSYPTFEEDESLVIDRRLIRTNSLDHALRYSRGCSPAGSSIYVIGGGELYNQTIGLADRLIISHIEQEVEPGVTFPRIDPSVFRQGLIVPYVAASVPFTVVYYQRIPPEKSDAHA